MKVVLLDNSIEDFIQSLPHKTSAKIIRSIELLEQFGSLLRLPHSKKISTQLFELRIRGQQEVRIIYTFSKNQAILIHGFIKKSQITT